MAQTILQERILKPMVEHIVFEVTLLQFSQEMVTVAQVTPEENIQARISEQSVGFFVPLGKAGKGGSCADHTT